MAVNGQPSPTRVAHRLRAPIARSWQRADLTGLDPSTVLERLSPVDVDSESPLLAASTPVLDELDRQLRGTQFCTVLVDRDGRVVRRWAGTRVIDGSLDELNIRLGASLLEEHVGTNALGTVLETRESLVVNGEEHFAEALRRFSCYGHPIRHPLTRHVEGVLDITTISDQASPLLSPLIARAVADIEQRLLDGSRASEKRLLDAFQAASVQRRRAVLAIGEDLVLSNQAALDLLGPGDVARLRMLAAEERRRSGVLDLSLDSGRPVTVEMTPVSGSRRSLVLQVDPCERPPVAGAGTRRVPSRLAPLLVSGPPGSGRTTRALELADRPPVTRLDAATSVRDGESAWAHAFEEAMGRRTGGVLVDGTLLAGGTVVIDDVDLLGDRLLDLVADGLKSRERPQVVLTSGPVESLTGRAATLAGVATRREVTLPLGARRTEIAAIAARILVELEPDTHMRLMPTTIAALAAHSWPGNLRELHAVLAHATQRRWGDSIAVKDLPDGYRSEVPDRPLAPLDQVQRDVIIATLQRCGGNKVQAARELELSRTTLYARMKALRITTY